MRKLSLVVALFTLALTHASFASPFDGNDPSMKQCDVIADACKKAGFNDEGTGDKSFWFGCMKPVLHGKEVKDVKVDAKDVKECRKAKISKWEKELKELKAVK